MIVSDGTHLPELSADPGRRDRATLRDAAANAYAQLLVSDIRLYHEEEVILGRRWHDLARRLDRQITSARERYTQRFSSVKDRKLFDETVLRVLAGGDPGCLGQQR